MDPAVLFTWVSLAVFFAIVWKLGVFGMLGSGLDKRAERIKTELDEARRLREEAQALLAEYQRKQREAEAEAAAIVASAQADAERLIKEGEQKVADFVARRTKMAEQKIAQAEAQAAAEVRAAAADAATAAAATILATSTRGAGGADLISNGIAELRGKLN
jgi:F-type H+-transporting ATPase subunit b